MDTVEWTSAEINTLHEYNRRPRTSDVPSRPPPVTALGASAHKSAALGAVADLSNAVANAVTTERRQARKYTAATVRHAKGSVGAERTPWEEKNRLDGHAFELANLVGECITDTVKALQRLRDECRVVLANVAMHGASKFPTDEVVPGIFASSTDVLHTLERGFLRLMPLMSSSVVLTEPLQLLNEIHRSMQREEQLPVHCPADAFLDRWKESTLARLRAGKPNPQPPTATERSSAVPPSSITDKTPLAYEMLLTPRTCLPVPPVYRPASSTTTPRHTSGRTMIKKIEEKRDELHSKYDIKSLQPKPLQLEPPSPLRIAPFGTKVSTPAKHRPKTKSTETTEKPTLVPQPKEERARAVEALSVVAAAGGEIEPFVVEPNSPTASGPVVNAPTEQEVVAPDENPSAVDEPKEDALALTTAAPLRLTEENLHHAAVAVPSNPITQDVMTMLHAANQEDTQEEDTQEEEAPPVEEDAPV